MISLITLTKATYDTLRLLIKQVWPKKERYPSLIMLVAPFSKRIVSSVAMITTKLHRDSVTR